MNVPRRDLARIAFGAAASAALVTVPDLSAEAQSFNSGGHLFADQYAGVQAAINALPLNGGVIDARSPRVNLGLDIIDPGTRQVTLLLGPYKYSLRQLVMRAGLQIYGTGPATTSITSAAVGDAVNHPMFVLPQAPNGAAWGMVIEGFALVGAPRNSGQTAILLDCSSEGFSVAGMWYSRFSDIQMTNFNGHNLWFRGRSKDAGNANQLSVFRNIQAFGNRSFPSTSNLMRIEGYAGQITFEECEFDNGSASANIYIGSSAAVGPNTIFLHNVTSQGGAETTGVTLQGAGMIVLDGMHFEGVGKAVEVLQNRAAGESSNWNIVIQNCFFGGNVGNGSGNGYYLHCSDPFASITFANNLLGNPKPDHGLQITAGATILNYGNKGALTYTGIIPSSGATLSLKPSPVVTVGVARSVILQSSAVPIKAIQGYHLPGETVTFVGPSAGSAVFSSGGNINLATVSKNSLILPANGTATFMRADAGGESAQWRLVART